jgi:hypothetical protein
MKDIISFHIADFLTILNIKPFKGIKKANCKRRSFDWKALWTSFDDIKCSETNNCQAYYLSSNKSRRKGECGLSNDGTHTNFLIFGMELLLIKVLVMMMFFMYPKNLSQK